MYLLYSHLKTEHDLKKPFMVYNIKFQNPIWSNQMNPFVHSNTAGFVLNIDQTTTTTRFSPVRNEWHFLRHKKNHEIS